MLRPMAALETLKLDVDRGVATITLHRPERLNAYTVGMGIELYATIARLDADDAVRVIVVTGAGRAFCAGADLAAGGETFSGERTWEAAAELERRVRPWKLSTPIIGAINGPAVGIGATLPLHWDIRVASDRAKIGFVFTRRGILPEANSTWILPRLVGLSRAMELLLTGRILSATEALEFGIVSRVIPDAEFAESVQAMARDIADNTAPVSVALTRKLLWRQTLQADPERAKALEDDLFYWIGRQPDAAEGVQAFLEKRAPVWKMAKSTALPDDIGRRLAGDPDPADGGT